MATGFSSGGRRSPKDWGAWRLGRYSWTAQGLPLRWVGGSGLGVKTSGVRRCCFYTTSSVSSSFRCRLWLASTFVLASWIRPLLRMIIMIIAELSGRCRQLPIVPGGEGQILDTKDASNIGPLDTHLSHVFINLVRYTWQGTWWRRTIERVGSNWSKTWENQVQENAVSSSDDVGDDEGELSLLNVDDFQM